MSLEFLSCLMFVIFLTALSVMCMICYDLYGIMEQQEELIQQLCSAAKKNDRKNVEVLQMSENLLKHNQQILQTLPQ